MSNRRYETLDGLRGIAAFAVVIYHLGEVKIEPDLLPSGYLAVDFFFALSGFVVALAYEQRLKYTLSLSAFLIRRLKRLYPLALLGSIFGIIVLISKACFFPEKTGSLSEVIESGAFNLVMFPMFFGTESSRYETFPGNGPLWTLFFEMSMNGLWAWLGIHMKTKWILLYVICSGFSLVALATRFHTANLGFDTITFEGGIARVSFGFPLGVIIYRLRSFIVLPSYRPGLPILSIVLITVFFISPTPATYSAPWSDFVAIFLFLPAIVVLGVSQESGSWGAATLGRLSYPVYVIHFPFLLVISGVHQTILKNVNAHILSIFTVISVLIIAIIALRFYEEPCQRLLSRQADN